MGKQTELKGLLFDVGKPAVRESVPHDRKKMENFLGGSIAVAFLPDNLAIVYREDANESSGFNRKIGPYSFYGKFLIMGHDSGGLSSLGDTKAEMLLRRFSRCTC